jgi:hypothetical protein
MPAAGWNISDVTKLVKTLYMSHRRRYVAAITGW